MQFLVYRNKPDHISTNHRIEPPHHVLETWLHSLMYFCNPKVLQICLLEKCRIKEYLIPENVMSKPSIHIYTIYLGCHLSYLVQYEHTKTVTWKCALSLVIIFIVPMQEFNFLWFLLVLQMTLRNRRGEVQVVREQEFPTFLNHFLVHCYSERWHHWNVYSSYKYNQINNTQSTPYVIHYILRSKSLILIKNRQNELG